MRRLYVLKEFYGSPEYAAWVAETNRRIAAINASIRATNGPKYGPETTPNAVTALEQWTKTP